MKSAIASLLLLVATAQAEEPAPVPGPAAPTVTVTKPAPSKWKNKFTTYGSFGFNVYTHLGATDKAPAADLTPASRAIIFQQAGFGYFFHPLFRVQLTLIFGEVLTNQPPGTSTFGSLGIVPWIVFSTHGFFTGIGPQLLPISYGKAPNFDAGIYTATGYAVKLGRGFSLPINVQLVLSLYQRVAFAVTPAVALAYRF